MPPSESRPDAAIGIAGLTPPSESCGNRSRFPPVAVHARVIVCVLYRPATVVFRVSGEYPMSLSRFGIVGLVLAAGLGLSACASDGYYGGASLGYGGYYGDPYRSEEHTSELQSLMRISYAVFCLKKKKPTKHDKYIS